MGRIILITLLLSTSALGQWSNQTLELAESFGNRADSQIFPNMYEASLWGSVQSQRYRMLDLPHILVSSKFSESPLKVPLKLQSEKSELVIFLPGIFNRPGSGNSRRGLHLFANLGYHTAVIPNTWSKDFIETIVPFAPGDTINESLIILSLIKKIKERIGSRKITKTHLVGFSYGGILAAIVASRDAAHLIDGQTTIVSPPLHLGKTIKRLDGFIDVAFENFDQMSSSDKADIVAEYLFARSHRGLSATSRFWTFPFMTVYGFHRPLISTAKAYNKAHRLRRLPPPWNTDWDEKFRYRDYLEKFAYDLLPLLDSEKAHLVYWLKKALNLKQGKVRLLTCENDFLNDEATWSDFRQAEIPSQSLILLPEGGHLGIVAYPWFSELLESAFPRQKAMTSQTEKNIDRSL
jgi:pimeloyl-ACP methyl ester carboxylesterase